MRTPEEKLALSFSIHPFDQEKCALDLKAINVELAKGRKFDRHKVVRVHWHDEPIIVHALVQRLQEVENELVILRLTHERELTREERWKLPPNLSRDSREDLRDQVDSWISLKDTLEGLIEDFKIDPLNQPHVISPA